MFSFHIASVDPAQGADQPRYCECVGMWGQLSSPWLMSIFKINKKEKILFSQSVFWVRIEAIKYLMLNISFLKKWISMGIYIYYSFSVDTEFCALSESDFSLRRGSSWGQFFSLWCIVTLKYKCGLKSFHVRIMTLDANINFFEGGGLFTKNSPEWKYWKRTNINFA